VHGVHAGPQRLADEGGCVGGETEHGQPEALCLEVVGRAERDTEDVGEAE
jgi:hypothetical protein